MKTILKDMELNKDLQEPINKLSGGEQQRIALARVALMKPNVYILDEPTSALDDSTEVDVMQTFIKNAKAKDQTVIFITHSEELARTYSDEVIIILFCLLVNVYLFVIIVFLIFQWSGISRKLKLTIATLRMTFQLVIAGYILSYLFDNPNPFLVVLVVLFMELFAIYTIFKSI